MIAKLAQPATAWATHLTTTRAQSVRTIGQSGRAQNSVATIVWMIPEVVQIAGARGCAEGAERGGEDHCIGGAAISESASWHGGGCGALLALTARGLIFLL